VFLTHHCAGDKIEKNDMSCACNVYGVERAVYRVLVGKRERNSSLGRPRRRWEDNMTGNLQEVGCGDMD
jgi:hypothetical protein